MDTICSNPVPGPMHEVVGPEKLKIKWTEDGRKRSQHFLFFSIINIIWEGVKEIIMFIMFIIIFTMFLTYNFFYCFLIM